MSNVSLVLAAEKSGHLASMKRCLTETVKNGSLAEKNWAVQELRMLESRITTLLNPPLGKTVLPLYNQAVGTIDICALEICPRDADGAIPLPDNLTEPCGAILDTILQEHDNTQFVLTWGFEAAAYRFLTISGEVISPAAVTGKSVELALCMAMFSHALQSPISGEFVFTGMITGKNARVSSVDRLEEKLRTVQREWLPFRCFYCPERAGQPISNKKVKTITTLEALTRQFFSSVIKKNAAVPSGLPDAKLSITRYYGVPAEGGLSHDLLRFRHHDQIQPREMEKIIRLLNLHGSSWFGNEHGLIVDGLKPVILAAAAGAVIKPHLTNNFIAFQDAMRLNPAPGEFSLSAVVVAVPVKKTIKRRLGERFMYMQIR